MVTMSPPPPHDPLRRRLLVGAASVPLAAFSPSAAANTPAAVRGSPQRLRLAQLLDGSADQQDISRDYATGVRLAVNEFNRSAPREVDLITFTSDGSAASAGALVRDVAKDRSLCALLGTAGERLALDSIAAARAEGLRIAHIAPWMSDARYDGQADVVPVFASREAQIRYALKSLEGMGMADIGLVYADERVFAALHPGVDAAARTLQLRPTVFVPKAAQDIAGLAAQLPNTAPVIMLFIGGTIELARFAQRLSARGLQRWLVSLADIDVGTLTQLGVGRAVPLILTQVVHNPYGSTMASLREYRAQLQAQFDEKPSHMSLAGYLAGRYALRVVARIEGVPTRESVLAEFARRPREDIGGFRIDFSGSQARGSSYVAQTLLRGDGRLLG